MRRASSVDIAFGARGADAVKAVVRGVPAGEEFRVHGGGMGRREPHRFVLVLAVVGEEIPHHPQQTQAFGGARGNFQRGVDEADRHPGRVPPRTEETGERPLARGDKGQRRALGHLQPLEGGAPGRAGREVIRLGEARRIQGGLDHRCGVLDDVQRGAERGVAGDHEVGEAEQGFD